MPSKAERAVRERYPDARAHPAPLYGWYDITVQTGDIVGTGPHRLAAWGDAAGRLPPKEIEG